MIEIGDPVFCVNDLKHITSDGEEKLVKAGHTLIVRGRMENKLVLERYGKIFIVDKYQVQKK